MSPRIGPRRASVYRIYDGSGTLIYVGTTHDVNARMRQHSRKKEWWSEVQRIEAVEYDSEYIARIVESVTIIDENPKYNIVRNATTESRGRFAAKATRRAWPAENIELPNARAAQ